MLLVYCILAYCTHLYILWRHCHSVGLSTHMWLFFFSPSVLISTHFSPLVFSVYYCHSFFVLTSRPCGRLFISALQSCASIFYCNFCFFDHLDVLPTIWLIFLLIDLFCSSQMTCRSVSPTSGSMNDIRQNDLALPSASQRC